MGAGQDLVVGGFIGLEGTVYAAEHLRERLQRTLPGTLLHRAMGLQKEMRKKPEEAVLGRGDVAAAETVGEGGILAALWNLAEQEKAGLTVYLRQIPIRQETIEICEALELNPYGLLSGGCTLFAADNGNDLLYFLKEADIYGAVIGKVTKGRDRVIINGGVRSYLNRPAPDEIKKLEGKWKENWKL